MFWKWLSPEGVSFKYKRKMMVGIDLKVFNGKGLCSTPTGVPLSMKADVSLNYELNGSEYFIDTIYYLSGSLALAVIGIYWVPWAYTLQKYPSQI